MTAVGSLIDSTYAGNSTISANASVAEAAELMKQRQHSALIVTENNCAIGIVTRRDVLERVVTPRRSPHLVAVRTIMSCELVTVSADASIEAAMELMRRHAIRHLPLTRGAKLIGMVSLTELSTWLSAQREARISDLVSYITRG